MYKVNKVLHHKTVTNTNYKSEKKTGGKFTFPKLHKQIKRKFYSFKGPVFPKNCKMLTQMDAGKRWTSSDILLLWSPTQGREVKKLMVMYRYITLINFSLKFTDATLHLPCSINLQKYELNWNFLIFESWVNILKTIRFYKCTSLCSSHAAKQDQPSLYNIHALNKRYLGANSKSLTFYCSCFSKYLQRERQRRKEIRCYIVHCPQRQGTEGVILLQNLNLTMFYTVPNNLMWSKPHCMMLN